MSREVIKSFLAVRDLDKIADYIQRQSTPKRAIRFLKAAEATFGRLATLPNLGTAFLPEEPRLAGLRYATVSRYKSYVVFYRSMPDGIQVLRVLHGSRDLEGLLSGELDEDVDEALDVD